jgi:8-oxo-dGTP diphosphatase
LANKIGKFLVATGAIIENSSTGKILLLKRSGKKDYSPGIWEYTTGRLHQFEEPEDGLKREVREETGLEVEIIKPISIFHIFRGERIAENELVGIMFWCKADSEEVMVSEEHSGHMWIEAEEALKLMDKPGMKRDIEAFIRERKK